MKFYFLDGSTAQILQTIDVSSVNHTSYGAVIDAQGILWSSGHSGNNLLRLNPANKTFTKIEMGRYVYGLGIDKANHLFVSGYTSAKLSRLNVLNNTVEWTRDGTVTDKGWP